MLKHIIYGRLTVDLDGKWWLYTNNIPNGADAIGVVHRGEPGDVVAALDAAGRHRVCNDR